jgi:hypothetical protein
LSPAGERTLELRALQAVSGGDDVTLRRLLAEMRDSADAFLPLGVWSIATFGRRPSDAVAIAELMTEPDRPVDVRAAGQLQRAWLMLAQGRHEQAREALAVAGQLGDPDAGAAAAWIDTLPFVGPDDTDRQAVDSALAASAGGAPPTSPQPSSFYSAHNGVHALVNHYLRGVLATRRGDARGVRAALAALDAASGTEGAAGLARQLATGVRAQDALAAGDTANALDLLSSQRIEGWYELTFVSPYFAGALERFTLAELLYAAGREEEARGWYRGLRENTVAELAFAGPSLLREAAIHRRAGRPDEAGALEEQFAALWQDADPELLRRVRERYAR